MTINPTKAGKLPALFVASLAVASVLCTLPSIAAAAVTTDPQDRIRQQLEGAPASSQRPAPGTKPRALKTTPQHKQKPSRKELIKRLDATFVRDLPGFSDLSEEDRREFLEMSISAAEDAGLETEEGVACYALAVWWLGVNFELLSEALEVLLHGSDPELQKVNGMHEWLHAVLENPEDLSGAEEMLRKVLIGTEAGGELAE